MRQVRSVGGDVYWLAGIAAENARGTIKRWRDGEVVDLTPSANVRARVNEYGGGCYDVDEHALVYVDDASKAVCYQPHDGEARPITDGDQRWRFAGLRLASDLGVVLAVREHHRDKGEARTDLVALSLTGINSDAGRVLASGADFYGRPAYHRGQVAWAQWNHPNMPWDDAEIWRMPLGEAPTKVAGGDGVSAINPMFLGDGRLVWLDDQGGYWNITADDGYTVADDHDWCPAPWTLEEPPIAELKAGTLIGTRFVDGFGRLVSADVAGGIVELDRNVSEVESVACSDGVAYAIVTWAYRATALVALRDEGLTVLVGGADLTGTVAPEPMWFDGPAGRTHAWFYPVGNGGNPAPLLVKAHGGPTGMSRANLNLETQFWVSRGIAVLDVNYSGSAGFGRAYRERLKGQWGLLDVADCEAGVHTLIDAGRVDQDRVAIAGGSAGGYTTLQALATSRTFRAGISRYGIGDLEMLASDTHKFEARYLDGLVGPYPAAADVYRDRSPIHHVDSLSAPMLILQGSDDLVVPLNQAERMAAAVRGKGLPVALVVFEGEGHGFRMVENRRTALASELSFLGRVFGFTPADDLPALNIDNLP